MNEIKLRKATLNDLDALLAYEQEVIKAERPFDPTIKPDPVCYYSMEKMLVDDSYYVLVAHIDEEIISCGYAVAKNARPYLDHRTYAYLGFMFTKPAYRGKGVNGRIIEALVAWSKSRGLEEIRLTVYEGNEPAIRAYEKVGFKKHLIEMRMRSKQSKKDSSSTE